MDAIATPPADWAWRLGTEVNAASASVASGELRIVGAAVNATMALIPPTGPHLSLTRQWRARGFMMFWRSRTLNLRANDGVGVGIYDAANNSIVVLLQNAGGGRLLLQSTAGPSANVAGLTITNWHWQMLRVPPSGGTVELWYSTAAVLPTTEAGWTSFGALMAPPWLATDATLSVAVGLSLDGAGAGAPEGRFQRIGFFDPTTLAR